MTTPKQRYEAAGEFFLQSIEELPEEDVIRSEIKSSQYFAKYFGCSDIEHKNDLAPYGVSREYLFRYDDLARYVENYHQESEVYSLSKRVLEASEQLEEEYFERLVRKAQGLSRNELEESLKSLGVPKPKSDFEQWLEKELYACREDLEQAGFSVAEVADSVLAKMNSIERKRLQSKIEKLLSEGGNCIDIVHDHWSQSQLSVHEDSVTARQIIDDFLGRRT